MERCSNGAFVTYRTRPEYPTALKRANTQEIGERSMVFQEINGNVVKLPPEFDAHRNPFPVMSSSIAMVLDVT